MTALSRRRTAARRKLIEAIVARARELGTGCDVDVDPGTFVEHYYAAAEPEDLARDSDALAAAALGHLRFAAQRAPGTPKVRVFNPTMERDGWTSDRTVVQTVNDDMPFLVDSTTMTMTAKGHAIHATIHPLLQVERANDRLTAVKYEKAATTKTESFIHVEITREAQAQVLADLEQALLSTLGDVRAAVADWRAMLTKLRAAATELRAAPVTPKGLLEESCDFLDWLADNRFTLLGYREYELVRGARSDTLRPRPGTGLGILRGDAGMDPAVHLSGRARTEARSKTPLVITKANRRSTVHRPALLDHIGVKVFDKRGAPQFERRFLGLFTSVAYNERPRDIPLLRHKVAQLMARSKLDPLSHRGKNLQHVLDTFPRDDLLQGSIEDLEEISAGILSLQVRHRVRLFCRRETFGRSFSCLVYLPRDHYTIKTRRRIEQLLLTELAGRSVESELALTESAMARLVVTVHTDPRQTLEPDVTKLEREIEGIVRTWGDRLRAALIARLPEDRALELYHGYAEHFSASYQEDIDADRASDDVQKVARVHEGESEMEITLSPSATKRPQGLRFTTIRAGSQIRLHVALPILEDMGFKVISARPYVVRLSDTPVWIQDFELELARGKAVEASEIEARFQACFTHVLNDDAESDSFNGFVVSAGLDWREAALLRAYCKYIRQGSIPFSQAYMRSVLARFPEFCRALVMQFHSLFDPDLPDREREQKRRASERIIAQELDRTVSLDDDRTLRAFATTVAATLRTNFFQLTAGERKPYISFKLDPSRIPELPRPRPKYEIYVYSHRVEGVHLRGGKIARGGLRWSDRREDFRTEVLGLMKAQQVKNTVIVPSGAKGGFYCKRLPTRDRDAIHAEVVSCYQVFVRGMLDLTDNIVDASVVGPERTLAHDEPDPYLVVAADKGTAAFSDIANALAAEYGFWLGDAFASGGSAGYDHKKMGITARGGWESVKRHFRELDIDVQREPITVAGIGDMSGDVFGNAMLLSPQLKLVAAFNHQHVFIDPSPDPAASFAERERLFHLPRSSWEDYDTEKLSPGGAVYSRHSKSIELSEQAQAALGIESRTMTPPELVRAVLKAPVDLLWNGGIGTYVKSSGQSHGDAGDPANDALRVNGNELRCRVVGEGGNLGFTHQGRTEYALAGGRINTDFIDNSGGVDSSDREVNIKILLSDAVDQRKLVRSKRNALLAEMTDEVAGLVLANNYAQTQALSIMESRAVERLSEHARLIRVLESQGWLDRALEFLPTEEQIEERRALGLGLTRPELAIVLSYSKIELRASLLASDVPEDPYLASELEAYFPQRLTRRFKALLPQHKLAREIIAMLVGSSMINRMGPFFVLRAEEETGANVTQVARAYAIVREVFDVRRLWREIEALDYVVAASVQYESIFQISRMVRRAVYWFLQHHSHALAIEPMVTRFREGAEQIRASLGNLVIGRSAEKFARDTKHFEELGLTPALARRTASLAVMTQALDIIELADESQLTVQEVGALYFDLAHRLRLDWLREQIEGLKVEGRWRAMARATLRETLAEQLRALARGVLRERAGRSPQDSLKAWLAASQPEIARIQRSLDEMHMSGQMDFATLSVALKEVGRLV